MIGERADERREQVAVGEMELDHVEAGTLGQHRGRRVLRDHAIHVFTRRLARNLRTRGPRDGRGRYQIPAAFGQGHIRTTLPRNTGGTLAPGMTELRADGGIGIPVHEGHDPRPGIRLRLGPQPCAAVGYAGLGGDAEHLGIDESHAAHGTRAVVHQMPVRGQTIHRAVLAHGRHLHAVLHAQRTDTQRLEHRRHRVVRVDIGKARGIPHDLREGTIKSGDVLRIAQLQVLVGDALAAHEHVEGELLGSLHGSVTIDVLEPGETGDRRALQAVGLGLAHGLILGERGGHIVGAFRKTARQRDRILHGELGARANGEMRRTARITDQHHVAPTEALVADHRECAPHRTVGDQRVASQVLCKQRLAIAPGIVLGGRIHAGCLPGLFAALDDPGGGTRLVTVGMRPPPAVLVMPENETEVLHRCAGGQPAEFVVPHVGAGAEFGCMRLAEHRHHAVASNHQVVVLQRDVIGALHVHAEAQVHAKRVAALLQDVQQF